MSPIKTSNRSSWRKVGKLYRLRHPQVSGTLQELKKGLWQARLWLSGAVFGFSLHVADLRAAKAAAERDIADLVAIHRALNRRGPRRTRP